MADRLESGDDLELLSEREQVQLAKLALVSDDTAVMDRRMGAALGPSGPLSIGPDANPLVLMVQFVRQYPRTAAAAAFVTGLAVGRGGLAAAAVGGAIRLSLLRTLRHSASHFLRLGMRAVP